MEPLLQRVVQRRASRMPPNGGQKFKGGEAHVFTFKVAVLELDVSAVGPEAWLALLFSLFSFLALPVRTYSCEKRRVD